MRLWLRSLYVYHNRNDDNLCHFMRFVEEQWVEVVCMLLLSRGTMNTSGTYATMVIVAYRLLGLLQANELLPVSLVDWLGRQVWRDKCAGGVICMIIVSICLWLCMSCLLCCLAQNHYFSCVHLISTETPSLVFVNVFEFLILYKKFHLFVNNNSNIFFILQQMSPSRPLQLLQCYLATCIVRDSVPSILIFDGLIDQGLIRVFPLCFLEKNKKKSTSFIQK